jgi:hypothetical protein
MEDIPHRTRVLRTARVWDDTERTELVTALLHGQKRRRGPFAHGRIRKGIELCFDREIRLHDGTLAIGAFHHVG